MQKDREATQFLNPRSKKLEGLERLGRDTQRGRRPNTKEQRNRPEEISRIFPSLGGWMQGEREEAAAAPPCSFRNTRNI